MAGAAVFVCLFVCLMSVGLRLMGIGRNQYIDLMNQYRSKVTDPLLTLISLISLFLFLFPAEVFPSSWYP